MEGGWLKLLLAAGISQGLTLGYVLVLYVIPISIKQLPRDAPKHVSARAGSQFMLDTQAHHTSSVSTGLVAISKCHGIQLDHCSIGCLCWDWGFVVAGCF